SRRLPRRLGGPPESLERFPVGRFAQLLECPFSDLPDSLTSDAHQRADLFERHRLAAFFESVVEIENLALAWREILLENPVDEFARQHAFADICDVAAVP